MRKDAEATEKELAEKKRVADVLRRIFLYFEYADLLFTGEVSKRWHDFTLRELQRRKKLSPVWAYFGGTRTDKGFFTPYIEMEKILPVDVVGRAGVSGIPPLPEPLVMVRGCVLDNGKIVIAGRSPNLQDDPFYVLAPGKRWKATIQKWG